MRLSKVALAVDQTNQTRLLTIRLPQELKAIDPRIKWRKAVDGITIYNTKLLMDVTS
jgi:hypothetical protein